MAVASNWKSIKLGESAEKASSLSEELKKQQARRKRHHENSSSTIYSDEVHQPSTVYKIQPGQ